MDKPTSTTHESWFIYMHNKIYTKMVHKSQTTNPTHISHIHTCTQTRCDIISKMICFGCENYDMFGFRRLVCCKNVRAKPKIWLKSICLSNLVFGPINVFHGYAHRFPIKIILIMNFCWHLYTCETNCLCLFYLHLILLLFTLSQPLSHSHHILTL